MSVGESLLHVELAKKTQLWPWRLAAFTFSLRNPALVVASLLTLFELTGQNVSWYWIPGILLTNLLAVRVIVWLTTTAVLYCLVFLHKLWKMRPGCYIVILLRRRPKKLNEESHRPTEGR